MGSCTRGRERERERAVRHGEGRAAGVLTQRGSAFGPPVLMPSRHVSQQHPLWFWVTPATENIISTSVCHVNTRKVRKGHTLRICKPCFKELLSEKETWLPLPAMLLEMPTSILCGRDAVPHRGFSVSLRFLGMLHGNDTLRNIYNWFKIDQIKCS